MPRTQRLRLTVWPGRDIKTLYTVKLYNHLYAFYKDIHSSPFVKGHVSSMLKAAILLCPRLWRREQ